MNRHRVPVVVVLISMILSTLVSCRKSGKSLALPAKPTLPYQYSQDDYKGDLALYNANVQTCEKPPSTNCSTTFNPDVAQIARNRIAWGLMGLIDELYNEYAANLYSGKGAIGILGDSETLGLTAASVIARQVATKTILGALGTAFAGLNLSADKNLFAQQTFQVIALAMETRRTEIYAEISDGVSKKSVIEYPLSAVKRDLVLYLYAGSLPGGLQEIQKEAGAASAAINAKTKPAGAPTNRNLKITSTALPDAAVNVAYPSTSLQTEGGTAPLNWSVTPLLPAGLIFDTTSGNISGTPIAASPKTPYIFTVTDSSKPSASVNASIFLQIK